MYGQRIGREIHLWQVVLALFLLVMGWGLSEAQNVVSNSGFEEGTIGGLPNEWDSQKENGAEGGVTLTDEDPHTGKQCLLIEHTNENGYIHPNKDVKLEPGDYIFRLWARSDRETGFLAQIYQTTNWSIPFSELCNLERGEWTKYEFPVSFLDPVPGSIQIGLTDQGRLWLDDVELVKRESSEELMDIELWDTVSSFHNLQDRMGWKAVPAVETTPTQPRGDLVLENQYLTVVFSSQSRGVMIYSDSGAKRAELMPLQLRDSQGRLSYYSVLRNTDDDAVVQVHFSATGMQEEISATFSFNRGQIISVDPDENLQVVSIFTPIRFAMLPSFISDDLVFAPEDYSPGVMYLPSENFLIGLLEGGDSMLVFTWPTGDQEVSFALKQGLLFESVNLKNDGKDFHLALLEAPGIWHERELDRIYLESKIIIDWKRPFPAKWVTQLYEDGVKTRYAFRESESRKEGFWRAAVGYYTYPVWFTGDNATYYLSKRVPPEGESLIYCVERKGTPVSTSTPIDILRRTLDNETYQRITDPAGRQIRSLIRPDHAVGMATCGVTDRLKVVFEAGEEIEKKDYIAGGTEDMLYFLARERERALEYQAFAHEMIEFLARMKDDNPNSMQFLDRIESITRELITEYEYEKEHIKDSEYSRKLAEQTQALTKRRNPDNLAAFMKLKREWTAMGGAVDDLNRKLHTITRKLFQEAGYRCVEQQETVEIAEEIRRRTVRCLRNPGSYEIWSNY